MDQECCTHIHHKTLIYVITLIFILLFAGEYYLYRSQMKINRMLSEGLMQLKEQKCGGKEAPSPIIKNNSQF